MMEIRKILFPHDLLENASKIIRIIMGSVADHVAKSASMPVLTINPFKPKVQYVAF